MKELIIMSSTVERANYEWKKFLYKYSSIIKRTSGREVSVELLNGMKIYFRGETESQRKLKGLHGSVVSIDEFHIILNRK